MSFGINVYKHTITFDSDMHTPVAGSTGIEMQFTFSKDYEGMAKCICFCVKDKLGDNVADVLPTVLLAPEQNTAVLPWEVLKPEYVGFELLIGISAFSAGSKVIYPTTYFRVGEILEGAKCTDVEPLEPTTPIVVELYKVAQEAKDIATEANAKVDAVRAEWDKALQDDIFKGEKGDSAYKVAQLNGFTGTEEEWLASLKGKDGKDGKDALSYIDDGKTSETTLWSSKKTFDELTRPQHNTMIVTAQTEGFGFKADYNSDSIKHHADGGGVVILRFNAPDGSGEQSYMYETYKDGYAVFRRGGVIDSQEESVARIIIKIDRNYNVAKEEEILNTGVDVDAEMSDTSENPVQNKVAKSYIDAGLSTKADTEGTYELIETIDVAEEVKVIERTFTDFLDAVLFRVTFPKGQISDDWVFSLDGYGILNLVINASEYQQMSFVEVKKEHGFLRGTNYKPKTGYASSAEMFVMSPRELFLNKGKQIKTFHIYAYNNMVKIGTKIEVWGVKQ